MRDIVLFGVGSALTVEYEETCRRLPAFVIAAIRNRNGPSFARPETPALDLEALPEAVRSVPCLCPIFTPANRRIACGEAIAAGFRFAPALIDPSATVAASCTFGQGSYVNAGCTIGAYTRLDEHVVVNRSASIGHHVSIGSFSSLGPGVVLCGDVIIGSGVMLGAGAVVLPSVRIGAGAVVGAGSVVVADVEEGARVFGNPAVARLRAEVARTPNDEAEDGAPLVSVAIKSHDHAPYVAQAIQSVLDQTLQDFEIVVTDDGSTDGTAQIVAQLPDPRIRLERFATNRGISASMTATVARSRGEFVAILNSDDVAMPERLEKQVAYLRAHPEVAAVFDVPRCIGEDGEPVEALAGVFDVPFEDAHPPREAWLHRFFFHGNSLCAPSAMIRRSVYRELGPDDPRLALLMDLDRWIRLLERHEIHVMTDGLTAFRVRGDGGNASAGNPANRLRDGTESLQVFKRYAGFEPELLRRVFAAEIAANGIDVERPTGVWLAEVALLGTGGWQPLFALELLYAWATEPRDVERIRELSGRVDPFHLNR